MKGKISLVFFLLLMMAALVACASAEQSNTERVVADLTASEQDKFNLVVFYENELPSEAFQDEVNKVRDYLLERNRLGYLSYVDTVSNDFKNVFTGLTPPHLIIFGNEGASFNATKPEKLLKDDVLDSLLDEE